MPEVKFNLLEELIAEEEKKRDAAKKIKERFEELDEGLEFLHSGRQLLLKQKVMGLATDEDIQLTDEEIEIVRAEVNRVEEELKVIDEMVKGSPYDEHVIRDKFQKFLESHYQSEIKPMEENIREAKQIYESLIADYANAISEAHAIGSRLSDYMQGKGMNRWVPRMRFDSKGLFVSKEHAKSKGFIYL